MTGPGGAPEPQIAHWVPTTPLFDLEQSAQAEMNRRNISAVAAQFARHGCALTTRAYIEVLDPEGALTVQDSPWACHAYPGGVAFGVSAGLEAAMAPKVIGPCGEPKARLEAGEIDSLAFLTPPGAS